MKRPKPVQGFRKFVQRRRPAIKEDGPDHDKNFVIGVFVAGKLRGKGSGPSKQIGQQAAAEAALKTYKS